MKENVFIQTFYKYSGIKHSYLIFIPFTTSRVRIAFVNQIKIGCSLFIYYSQSFKHGSISLLFVVPQTVCSWTNSSLVVLYIFGLPPAYTYRSCKSLVVKMFSEQRFIMDFVSNLFALSQSLAI